MRCTCQTAAREARKAAFEEAARLCADAAIRFGERGKQMDSDTDRDRLFARARTAATLGEDIRARRDATAPLLAEIERLSVIEQLWDDDNRLNVATIADLRARLTDALATIDVLETENAQAARQLAEYTRCRTAADMQEVRERLLEGQEPLGADLERVWDENVGTLYEDDSPAADVQRVREAGEAGQNAAAAAQREEQQRRTFSWDGRDWPGKDGGIDA